MKNARFDSYISPDEVKRVHDELMRRRDLLISFAHDRQTPMESLDRECIVTFFERWELPKKPESIPELMKTFFTCCFTYAPLRKYLASVAGSIPTPEMLPECLSKVYSEEAFLLDQNWSPMKLHAIAEKIQEREKFDLKSNQFQPRMISVLLDGSLEMQHRLILGLESFYSELEEINGKSGYEIWAYVSSFSKNIYNVGTALICDFLKDIGCDQFVKVDHHFKNEFPKLLGFSDCKKLSSKDHFVLSQSIADFLKLSPFHLDHLLYQWGRYKKYE